jgi:hypothetical protein
MNKGTPIVVVVNDTYASRYHGTLIGSNEIGLDLLLTPERTRGMFIPWRMIHHVSWEPSAEKPS